jgi:hypothetical protein
MVAEQVIIININIIIICHYNILIMIIIFISFFKVLDNALMAAGLVVDPVIYYYIYHIINSKYNISFTD